jgi:ABC-type branched-subunit amino acid transport system ATPase component
MGQDADTGQPAIEVRALRKSFGTKEAVAGIGLEIAAGSLAGLVGPNGAGKTTSLSMMTGLLRPDSGQILINGLDVWADPRAAKAVIGVVPDQARLFERLSGAEMLEYAGRLRGLPALEARSRTAQLLDVLDLTADAKRLVADYSTGMRKKAMLGCALIHNPSALLRLALLAAVIVAAGWLWIRSLSRAQVTADTTTQSSQVHGAALPLARYGLRGAVTARFWIYQRREPASLVFWALTAVIMVAVSARAILGPHGHPAFVLGSAVLGAGFVGYFHANTVGLTGPPFVLEAMALTGRRGLRSYFFGQNIVLGVIAVPLLAGVSFGLAAVVGRPGFGFLGTAVGLAGLGGALALSNIFTVVMAYPMDKRPGNPIRQPASGYTSYQFLAVFGSVGGTALAAAPVIIATVLTSADPASVRMPALLLFSTAYGLALAKAGPRIAAAAAEGRLPELCQVAIRSKL